MEPMDKIRESLQRIAELKAEDLESLQGEIADEFDRIDAEPTTPENVALLQELSAAISTTMTRADEIAAATQKAESDKEAARAVRAALDGKPDEGEGDAPTTDTDVATVDAEADALVAAGKLRGGPRNMRQRNITPVADAPLPRASLIAAGPLPGKVAGSAFADRWELAEVMSRQLQGMHKGQSHGRVVVASADFSGLYPEDRRLIQGDNVGNGKKFDAVTGLQALIAAGGTCLPVNVDYTLDTWATAARPLKAGIAQYQAERGGLTFRQPPTVAALAGATSVWTEATDANPDGATKPVLAITCASPETVLVDAIPTRLGFGNLMGQFDPDTIAANTDLAIAAAARIAETNLLTHIQAACTLNVTSAHVLGASRDMFSTVDGVCANFRYTHRLPDSQFLTVILPNWAKSLIRADRVKELAHDNAGSTDVFGVSDAWIDAQFAVRGIKCIWTLDALPVAGDSSYPTQQFSGFTASAAVPAYPAKLVWNIYIEGSIQFLDSGLLNLGVVRDATLDSTNDYETFIETFEGIAFRGFSGGALQVVSTLTPCGGSSGSVAVC